MAGGLTIGPPFTAAACASGNAALLERVRRLVGTVQREHVW